MRKNFVNNELVIESVLAPQVLSADENGSQVDTQGFDSIVFAVHVGVSGDTLSGSVKLELEVEESDTAGSGDTDAADVALENPETGAAGAVVGTNPGTFAVIDDPAEDDAVYYVRYIGSKRYARPVVNLTGTHTNGIPVGIVALKQRSNLRD